MTIKITRNKHTGATEVHTSDGALIRGVAKVEITQAGPDIMSATLTFYGPDISVGWDQKTVYEHVALDQKPGP